MSILRDIARIGRAIMVRQPFYGLFLTTLNKVEDPNLFVKTAGVGRNGINLQLSVHPDFWRGLTEEHKYGVLIHELMHICFYHVTDHVDYDNPKMFNIAADLYINSLIINSDYTNNKYLPGAEVSKAEYDSKYKPKLEQIMKDLKDGKITREEAIAKSEEIPMRPCLPEDYNLTIDKSIQMGTRKIYNYLMDNQDNLPQVQAMMQAQQEGIPVVCSHKDWAEVAGSCTDAELKAIGQQMKSQLKQTYDQVQKSQGNIPNELRGMLEELLRFKPPIFDWKGAIRRFVGGFSDRTYTKRSRLKPNKRFPDMPSIKIKNKQHIMVAADTSGSVSWKEYKEFLIETNSIKRATGCDITFVECDAYVDHEKGVWEYKDLKDAERRLNTGRVTGGGGTSFEPPLEYANMFPGRFTCIIYFTDGWASVPETKVSIPTMWVMSSNGKSAQEARDEGFKGYIIKIPENWT